MSHVLSAWASLPTQQCIINPSLKELVDGGLSQRTRDVTFSDMNGLLLRRYGFKSTRRYQGTPPLDGTSVPSGRIVQVLCMLVGKLQGGGSERKLPPGESDNRRCGKSGASREPIKTMWACERDLMTTRESPRLKGCCLQGCYFPLLGRDIPEPFDIALISAHCSRDDLDICSDPNPMKTPPRNQELGMF
ncbi:uncharacterized protein PV07_02501 [Cladophialophora immunda]|uniref:Uncharacterized protein n=1 Tax=Cladophialophora immunda TaxID=569365 RepID=A0A0D2CL33_9EURO|nr:uncharacterized protein PV07_02501 [Cladophialophora immunda]KIW30800.1 hypothetical protein PV07_02501 [Cladophialophora immunda]